MGGWTRVMMMRGRVDYNEDDGQLASSPLIYTN